MKFLSIIKKQYNVIFERDISDYYNLPIEQIFQDLTSIKKDVYEGSERIVFYDPTDGLEEYYKLINQQLVELDIPDFFIIVVTNNFLKNIILHNPEFDGIKIGYHKELIHDSKIVNPPSIICVNPWINVEIQNSGKFNFCCEYNENSEMNVNKNSIKEFYNSDFVNNVRQSFLNNKIPSGCNKCFDIEKENGKSKRINDNFVYKEKKYKIDWRQNRIDKELVSLDLKIGNLCNLACRICNEDASSLWSKENGNIIEISHDKWFLENEDINDLNLEYLQITGGEPLLDKSHIKFLDKLIEYGKSKNINLHYNTNGTIYPSHLLDIWSKFKKVKLSLSIDNLFEKFNYERWGLVKWSTVENNIEKIISIPNIEVDVYTSVTVFNVLDLPKICNYFAERNIDISFNLVSSPKIYSITWLPEKSKEIIIEKLKNIDKITPIIEFMKNHKSEDLLKKFFLETQILDNKRNQNFKKTYPEMYELLSM